MEENKVKFFSKFNIIYLICVIMIPTFIGGVVSLIFQDLLYLELFLVLFGLFDLLLITIRIRARDSKNYKKTKSIVEDKTSDSFKEWLYFQYMLGLSGSIDLVLSLVAFAIKRCI